MSGLLDLSVLREMTESYHFVSNALLADQLKRAIEEIEQGRKQVADLKSQLSTCCLLAARTAEHAHHLALALDDSKGIPVGYWREREQ